MTETSRAFPLAARACLVGAAVAASLALAAWSGWSNGRAGVVEAPSSKAASN